MTWIKLVDTFPDHPKAALAGYRAGWLYVCGLCYCSRHLTDGVIPRSIVARLTDLPSPLKHAAHLVSIGLWEVHEEGWAVHDYVAHQTSREDVETKREATAERVRKHREKVSCNSVTNGVTNADVTAPEYRVQSTELEIKAIAKRRRSAPPSELVISPEMRAWARERGLTKLDLVRETSKMLDHHRAKGSMMLDWVAAWRTWMTRAGEYQPGLVTVNGKSQPAEGARIPPPVRTCGECDSGWTIDNEGKAIRCHCQRAS